MAKVLIGLGSNLEQPRQQLQRAIDALLKLPSSDLDKVSPFYKSAPMGIIPQADYFNAVVQLSTTLSPFTLLLVLQRIEKRQGRVRLQRWGPRTLDLDILSYDNLILNTTWLTLPHPGLHNRAFVLKPLRAIMVVSHSV